MRVKAAAACHGRFAAKASSLSPGSTAIMRRIVWARGPRHGRPLATARLAHLTDIDKAALRI
jgi:hypothetical protein